jgi:hypothetical protein
MTRRWRWSLVAAIAAAVLGSFLPGALLSAHATSPATAALTAEEPPVAPTGCFIASCGKGSPAPAVPTLTLAAVATLAAVSVVIAARARRLGRLRVSAALPRGTALTLFHPPQFS